MMRKRIPMGLTVGLIAAAIAGGAALVSCGGGAGNGGPEAGVGIVKDADVSTLSTENTEVESGGPDELAVRIAEILGADAQATHDAMVQADQADMSRLQREEPVGAGDADTRSEHAAGRSYMEYGERIGAVLDVDGGRVARAIAQAYEELYAVERDIRENGSGRDAEGKYESDKHPAEPAGG